MEIIKKREYLYWISTFLLLGLSIVLFVQKNKLNGRYQELAYSLKTSEDKIEYLKSYLDQKEYLLRIDNTLFESIAKEEHVSIDSLKVMFLSLSKDTFNDIINLRLKNTLLINEIITSKNQKINSSLSRVNELMNNYHALEHLYEKKRKYSVKLENSNNLINKLNDSLLTQIDSLRLRNIENLTLIELTKSGNTVYYIGSKLKGIPSGYGVGMWSTGGIYKGEWQNGLREGKGIYVWKDGEMYEGDWKEGMRTGQGKYTWKDKHTYVGGWLENKRHGFGSIYYPNGKLEYEGQWENDKFKQPHKIDREEQIQP